MSVDREYAPRISTEAENSSARHDARNVEDAVIGQKVGEDVDSFEKAPEAELRNLLQTLDGVLPGAGRLLRAALEMKAPDQFGNFSAAGKESNRSEASSTPLINQSNLFEESSAANSHPFPQSQNDPRNAGRDTVEFGATNELGAAAQPNGSPADEEARAGLANQVRQFQKTFEAQGPGMSRQDAGDLLAVLRQLGDAFFQQSQNNVTKQEFEREKIALRRLIESKGK